MKQIRQRIALFFVSLSLFMISCNVEADKAKLSPTKLRVIDSIKHYYPIRHHKEINIPYHIVNTGDKPLAIFNIESSGPCIEIKNYPKGPVQIGKEGTINVAFKSDGMFGYNKHYITFEANTPPFRRHTLIFDVVVVPDEFGYGDGFDYRYEGLQESKSAIDEAVEGDETQQGYYTDSNGTNFKQQITK